MGYDPIGIDQLASNSGLTGETLSAMLMVLELEGKVASLPGGRYQRIT
jgi:DNA processing protein